MLTVFASMLVFSASVALLGFALARSSRTGCCNCQRAQGVMARCSAAGLMPRERRCGDSMPLTTSDASE